MKSKKSAMIMIMFIITILPIVLLIYSKEVFTKKSYNITVVENDTVLDCRPSSTLLQGRKYRTAIPKYQAYDYCGAIITKSTGAIKLPPSNDSAKFHKGRAFLSNNLKAGCSYRVSTIGFGDEPVINGKPRVPLQKTIIEIEKETCLAN